MEMEDIHPDWRRLPTEVLLQIFALADEKTYKSHLLKVALVCKAWLIPAQSLLYSKVRVRDGPELVKFQEAIEKNPQLGGMVKTFEVSIFMGSEAAHQFIRYILATSLPNLQVLTGYSTFDLIPTVNTLLDSQLTHLRRLELSDKSLNEQQFAIYDTFVTLTKDRLENIYISNHFYQNARQSIDKKAKLERFYIRMKQFPRLVDIYMDIKANNDEIEILENVVEACKSLKNIEFNFSSNQQHNNNSTINDLSNYIPTTNIKSVKGNIYASNKHQLILYIIHKYQHLKQLTLEEKGSRDIEPIKLESNVIAQLLKHTSKMNKFSLKNLTLGDDNTLEVIANVWKESSTGNESIKLLFDEDNTHTSLEFIKEDAKSNRVLSLKYPGQLAQQQLYMDFIKNGGKYIGDFFISYEGDNVPYDNICELNANFMPYLIIYCQDLKKTRLEGCSLQRFNPSDFKLNSNTTIDEIFLLKCTVDADVLEQCSMLLPNLKEIYLIEVEYGLSEDSKYQDRKQRKKLVHKKEIIMPFTNIDTVTLSEFWWDVSLKVFVASTGEVFYYKAKYEETKMEISNEKYYYDSANHDEKIYIVCKTKPKVQLELMFERAAVVVDTSKL